MDSGVPKVVTEFLGRPFLAVTDLPAVDDHIVFVGAVVDAEGAKGEIIKANFCLHAIKDGVTNSSPHVAGFNRGGSRINIRALGRACDHVVS